MVEKLITILIASVLINNIVLTKFLGLCGFFGISKKVEPSVGLTGAVLFVIVCATLLCGLIYNYILTPLHMEYMRIVVFMIVIASFVQLVEAYMRKSMPELYKALGIYLVLITTNCIILASPLINIESKYNLLEGIVNAVGIGAGFGLAIILLAYIRERLELSNIPEYMKGLPISFITIGLMAIAFMGFTGLIKM